MTQQSREITHPEYMYIMHAGDDILYGCNQDWYRIEWRRRAGCGPVAATNILYYIQKRYSVGSIPYRNAGMEDTLAAMNDVFTYVRPKRRGLHTVRKFVKGMGKFGRSYGVKFRYRYIIVPPQPEKRPGLGEIVRFIEEGLDSDVPVAFLNLHAGEVEEQLSSWHWVTVVGITKCGPESGDENNPQTISLRFFDQSKSLEVDLGKWLGSTDSGGGFAYFRVRSPTRKD